MKSLTSHFPIWGLWAAGSARLGHARSRLVRVIGRHQAGPPAPPLAMLSEPPKPVQSEEEIRPLYGSSAYYSPFIDEELLRNLLDDEEDPS